MRLRYSLLADGSSDRALMPVINWALRARGVRIEQAAWADLGVARPKPTGLAERVRLAVDLYPCDLLFVHRDAEREPFEQRLREVRDAVESTPGHHVPIVPVRMTEAWLLHEERAIREASGNPNGTVSLALPSPATVDPLPDPKCVLSKALLTATEASGRRLKRRKRDLARMRSRVAELIDGFGSLEATPGFARFISDLSEALQNLAETETETAK